MKRVHFRQVNKKLDELRQAVNAANVKYLLSDCNNFEHAVIIFELFNAKSELQRFMNTKISDLYKWFI